MRNITYVDRKRYSKKYRKKNFMPWPVGLAFLFFFLNRFLAPFNGIVERYYSTGINKFFIQILSRFTGLFPFSIGEVLYVAHLLAIPVVIGILIYKLFKGGFGQFFRIVMIYVASVYLVFMGFWGFNYSRKPLSQIIGLEVGTYTRDQLYELNLKLIEKANALREEVKENEEGVMLIPEGYRGMIQRSDEGFERIGQWIPELSGKYGRPKPIALSKLMNYTGITGIYLPFTGEANVNVSVPDLLLPSTILHEMAHQRGFAGEDESNYIAYIVGNEHKDSDFKYSGTVLALIHSMNALNNEDPSLARELRSLYSEALNRDLRSYNEFWKAYEGDVHKTADKVNDIYLKSNGEIGTQSYGGIVDLLLADFLQDGEI